METYESLLPTPNARDGRGSHRKPRDNVDCAIEKGETKSRLFSREGSRASLSHKPEEDEERKMIAISGQKCFESSKYSIQPGSSLRMFVDSLLGTTAWYSKQCALIWRAKSTKYNRLLFQLVPLARRTEGIEYGLLPTVTTQEVEHPQAEYHQKTGRRIAKNGNTHSTGLADTVSLLPTPEAKNWEGYHNSHGKQIPKIGKKISKTGQETGERLRLQPAMTEWMMGFPEGWAKLPLAEQDGEKRHSNPTEMRLSRR